MAAFEGLPVDAPETDRPPEAEKRPARVQCSTCGEKISCEARKCIHCSTYQDWRRHLTFSTGLIALIASVLAGVGASYPVLREAWRIPDSNLRVSSTPLFEDGNVILLVTNSGVKPGVVDSVNAELPLVGGMNEVHLELVRAAGSVDTGVVPGDTTKALEFKGQVPAPGYPANVWDPGKVTKQELDADRSELSIKGKGHGVAGGCSMHVDLTSFKGAHTEVTVTPAPACWKFKGLLEHYWDAANSDTPAPE